MGIGSWVAERAMRLPPAQTRAVHVDRDLPAKMPDGVVLLADRYYPDGGASLPIVLTRTPYGRREAAIQARRFAERGYQVVVQSCRGTFGSGGSWDPFRAERDDGLATLAWLADQPWFSGTVVTYGPSYVGLTQWAIAEGAPEFVKAAALAVTSSNFRDIVTYPGGSFGLATSLAWLYQVEHQERPFVAQWSAVLRSPRALRRAFATLPIGMADRAAVGHPVAFYQDWVRHEQPGDPFWEPVDFRTGAATMPAPALLAGWYDIFLPAQLADYAALKAAGRNPRLTIGPWSHTSPAVFGAGIRDALEWFEIHAGRRPASVDASRVRIQILGTKRWVDLPDWPPPSETQRWHLHAGGRLAVDPPGSAGPDRYRYDPADPTPSTGGTGLTWWDNGAKDNKVREARADVLVYTSDPLPSDLTIVGPVVADLRLRSSNHHTDFFVRLCDVDSKAKSVNLADGIIRLRPEDIELDGEQTYAVRIAVGPIAATFRAGHRIRVQVSSGAHPLFARNPGSGEPLASAARLVATDHEVFHQSAVELPVTDVSAPGRTGSAGSRW